MDLYKISKPTVSAVPILISSPHSGTYIPKIIADNLSPEMASQQDDADWFIDKLYDFAPELGITLIAANYSRWVVDLNRDPKQKPLYNDGRVITGLVPTTDFNGNNLYLENSPDQSEIDDRIEKFYNPYHEKIESKLKDLRSEFGIALLFDAHSIRKIVPGIRAEAFPDLILGDNDQTSASIKIIEATLTALQQSSYHVSHNHPFKGGQITRSFGKPENNIHALQLEMVKQNYMDDSETKYDDLRANKMRILLKDMFSKIIEELT